MPEFPAQLLAQWTCGHWTVPPTAALMGFCVDSRLLRPGQIFVAIKTDKRDGHDFLPAARNAGAAAAIVAVANPSLALPQLVVADPLAAFHAIARAHRRAFPGKVIGISGSAGKTSTKDLLTLLLGGEACGVLATEGNLNNHLGVPLTLTRLETTHKLAVVEAGISLPGEMKPLADMIEPDVAIITLVAPAHTQDLGGIEGVAREKAVLPAAVRPTGIAIFPKQTAEFPAFRELGVRTLVVERAEVVRPDRPPPDKVFFAVSHRGADTAVSLAYGAGQPMTFVCPRVSDGMAQNAVIAISAALGLGIARDVIQARFAVWKPGKLRGEIRRAEGKLLYLDCYNANPASMADALATFVDIAPPDEPRLYVLGCMEELGEKAAAYHRALGRSIDLREGDRLFALGTFAHEICAGVLERGDFSRQIQIPATLEPVSACYGEWRGAVFVKGSRKYQLERLLEPSGGAVAAH
jgi:UDP-N-acetylmuramoyl-tripeptide--D-alanyl-D-alanine ligase